MNWSELNSVTFQKLIRNPFQMREKHPTLIRLNYSLIFIIMKLVDRFLGLGKEGQTILSGRQSLQVVLAGALLGAVPTLGCEPMGIPLECQEKYDTCHEKYLNCIYTTPAPDQEQKCEPIQDFCESQEADCAKQEVTATATASGAGDASGNGTTNGMETTAEGTTEGAPTSGGGSDGGSGSGGETGATGDSEPDYGGCMAPNCGQIDCQPGQPGAFCDYGVGDEILKGIIDCDGVCQVSWEGAWCDEVCNDGGSTTPNFNCPPFDNDGGACKEPLPADPTQK